MDAHELVRIVEEAQTSGARAALGELLAMLNENDHRLTTEAAARSITACQSMTAMEAFLARLTLDDLAKGAVVHLA